MIINEIGIENFGKLAGYRVRLDDGLNTFLQENGSGKTTLTYFIKAMLYGLEQTTRQSIFENERKRFAPWGGGAFGGFMCFTAAGRSYRAERRFGSKLAEDTFALYDTATGMPSSDFSEKLGEELFGIDADGFERTVFISEKLLGGENTNPTVAAKLSDLSGVEGDLGNFDKALNSIEKETKVYKKKGGSGILRDTEKLIREADKELEAIEKAAKAAAENERELQEIRKRRAALTERKAELDSAREAALAAEKNTIYKKHHEQMKADIQAKRQELDGLSRFFSKKLPTSEETYYAQDNFSKYERNRNLTDEIDDPALTEIVRFIGDDEGYSAASECRELRKEAREIAAKIRTAEAEFYQERQNGTKSSLKLGAIAALIMVISAVLAFVFLPAIALSAVMAVLLILITIKEMKKKRESEEVGKRAQEQISLLKDQQDSIALRLVTLANRFDKNGDRGLEEKLDLIEKNLSSYQLAKQALAASAQKRARLTEEGGIAMKRAMDFLELFPTVTERPFDEIRAKRAEYDALTRAISTMEQEAERYEREYCTATDPASAINSDELNAKAATLDAELIECERALVQKRSEAERYSAQISRKDEITDIRDEYELKLEAMQNKYDLLIKTKELLTKAKDALNAKYIGPTREGFERYMTMLDGECTDISVDTSFAVTKTDNGMTRIQDCYSKGTRDAMTLAVRLALCDTLYGDEQPPLILDDPYCSFDDRRIKEAIEILKKLSANRQILYFTCSGSRATDKI